MVRHPPDYLSAPSGDGEPPASAFLSNPLLRPLDGSPFANAILEWQEATAFHKGSRQSKIVGKVLAMCPSKEIQQKVEMNTASDLERATGSKVNPRLAMKSFQRSDASRVFKPEETRPAVWCRRTVYNALCYFIDADIVRKPYLMDKNFSYLDVYNFLRDRLRSIWQDLTVQHCTKHRAYIECFEISIRFLIYSNEVLCENEEYDIAQNTGLLNTCLDKLMQGYEDVHKFRNALQSKLGTRSVKHHEPWYADLMNILVYSSPHEGEFWAYRLLMHIPQLSLPGGSGTFCDIRQRMPAHLRNNELVTFASDVCHAAASGNAYRYFQLLAKKDTHAILAALMNRFAVCVRVRFIEILVSKKIAKKDVNPLDFNNFMKFLGLEKENRGNIEKLCTRYNITLVEREFGTSVELEDAKTEMLTYDTAAPQKLANKFQTSSVVVKSALDRFESRRKLMDPDFEYPKGTGPDTVGPEFTEESYAEEIKDITESPPTLNIFGPIGQTSSGFGFPNKATSGFEQNIFGKPFSLFPSGFGKPASGHINGDMNAEKGNTGFMGFRTPINSDPKPFTFTPSNPATNSDSFGSASGTNHKAGGTSSGGFTFGNSDGPLFGSPPATGATSSNGLFTFGGNTPKANVGASAFSFGNSSQLQTSSTPTFTFPAPEQPKEPNPFGSPQFGNQTRSKKRGPYSGQDNEEKGSNAFTFPGNKDQSNLFTFGATDQNNSGTPIFSFGTQAPTTDNRVTSAPLEEKQETPFAMINDNSSNLFGTPKPSTESTAKLFSFSAPTNEKDPSTQFAQQNIFGAIGTTGLGSVEEAPLDKGSQKPDQGPHEEAAKPISSHILTLAAIIKRSEIKRQQQHVKVRKPKISFNLKSIELDPALAVPRSKKTFDRLKRIGKHIMELASEVDDSEDTNAPSYCFKMRASIYSMDSMFYRLNRIGNKSDVLPGTGESTTWVEDLRCNKSRHEICKGELTPRKDSGSLARKVLYLTPESSKDYLTIMYNNYMALAGGELLLTNLVTCKYCTQQPPQKINYTTAANASLKHLGKVASSVYKCAAGTARFLSRMYRRYMLASVRPTPGDKSDNATETLAIDWYKTYNDLTDYTKKAAEFAVDSTVKAVAESSDLLSTAVGSTKRVLQRISDLSIRKLHEEESPLAAVVNATQEHIETIIKASEARLQSCSKGKIPIDEHPRWSDGVYWHLNFFDPLVERDELLNQSTCGSESGRRLTSTVLLQSIDRYMISDYCIRLKQDVLRLVGVEVPASRLCVTNGNHRRQMLDHYNGSILLPKKYEQPSSPLPVAVSISVNLSDDSSEQSAETVNLNSMETIQCNKRRKLLQEPGSQAQLKDGSSNEPQAVIQETCARYNNKVNVLVYALSCSINIGELDVMRQVFSAKKPVHNSHPRVNIPGIDVYGILSAIHRYDTRPQGPTYTHCLVCYRIGLGMTDLLTLYEFFNLNNKLALSFCGCTEETLDLRSQRLLEFISSLEARMLEEVLAQADQFNVKLGKEQLGAYVTFACVGFQLSEESRFMWMQDSGNPEANQMCQDTLRVPRIVYLDGLRRGLQEAAKAAIETQSVLLSQKAFHLPDLHSFLSDLLLSYEGEYTQHPSSLPTALHDQLQKFIQHVEENYEDNYWDPMRPVNISGAVKSLTDDGQYGPTVYSKLSFIELLKRLQDATLTYNQQERMMGAFAKPEEGELSDRVHNCVYHVLSNVVVKAYRVPYAIGFCLSNAKAMLET